MQSTKKEPVITHGDPQVAFRVAIATHRLDGWDETATNWVGHYMYMGTVDGVDQFKHRETRRYLPPSPKGWDVAETSVEG